MKILFVGHTYTVKVNRDKLYHLSKISGIQLRLITPKIWNEWTKKNRSEAFADENIELKTYRTLFNSNEGRYFFTSLSLGLKEFQPDIIHVEQGLDAYSYFQILLLKKIHKLHAKTVAFTWVNLPYKHRNPVKNFIEKFNMNNTDFIICGNREAQQILESKKFKGRSCVMPQLGIDPTMYRRKDVTKLKLKMGLNGFTIGYIGRITYQKGLATLFLALGTMKKLNWKLLMVGGEDWEKGYKKKLVEIAEKVGITRRIIWVDTINHDEAPDYFNCMDISVLPSLTLPYWKEQFGHTIIESMACAVPVIGSSSGEIPNVIGDAGLVFAENDHIELAEKLSEVIQNKNTLNELVHKSLIRINNYYTNKKIAQGLNEIYQNLFS